LLQNEYKAKWFGKTILRIGQFEPSSKLCSVCGYYNSDLTLKPEFDSLIFMWEDCFHIRWNNK